MQDHGDTTLSAEVSEVAHEAVRNPWTKRLAKLGFYSKGFLFITIGAVALAVVVGVRGLHVTDARGALAQVAQEPYGRIFLFIFVLGAIGHGLWNILRGLTDVDGLGRDWKAIVTRVFQCLLGCFYLGLAASAVEIVLEARVTTDSSHAEETFVMVLLSIPLIGASLIAIIGVGLIGGGLTECYRGLSGTFQDTYRKWEIRGVHRTLITVIGVLSFSVRAVLLVVMGWFFLRAAADNAPAASIGMDSALLALMNTSYGGFLVAIAGLGLIGHGILAFYEARFRRIC